MVSPSLGLGQRIYKLSLEDLLVPESKEMIKKKKKDRDRSKGQMSNVKELPITKAGPTGVSKISNMVVDYHPHYF